MIKPRQFVAFAALFGTVALAVWSTDKLALGPLTIGDNATPIADRDATLGANSFGAEEARSPLSTEAAPASSAEAGPSHSSPTTVTGSLNDAATSVSESRESIEPKVAEVSAEESSVEAPLAAPVRLTSAFPSKAAIDDPLPPVGPLELQSECLENQSCIDDYLWSLYERTPKVDTNKVTEKIKKAVKKDGKLRTIIQTITNYVVGDFTWKDPAAAQKADKPVKDYVIGGMDPGFKLKLYRALHILNDAGFMPGITSAFRDDYRQSIAEGNKAASDSSYHGGSRRGGFGHGLAADLVSVKGETRMERCAASEEMWKWIDAHEKELGIGRPYRDRDPPHVGPLDGKEYADKRGAATAQKVAAKTATKTAAAKPATTAKTAKTAKVETKKPAPTARSGTTKHAPPEKSSKVSSLQNSTTVQR